MQCKSTKTIVKSSCDQCNWSNVFFFFCDIDSHLCRHGAGQQPHLLHTATWLTRRRVTRRYEGVDRGRKWRRGDVRVCVWVVPCALLFGWWGGGFVCDIILTEWTGLLEFEPGIHTRLVELMSGGREIHVVLARAHNVYTHLMYTEVKQCLAVQA